ncbi:MAG: S-adenosylmethionine decarboxylase [Candidatus Aenigmatarchaeota archaeon]|nr:S-adenosylmethionine decarboxylase [Candidatus Aenigmarchaeota archaeon]
MTKYKEHILVGYLFDIQNIRLLNNAEGLRRLVRKIGEKSNATVFGTHIKKYPGGGINAVADIGESVIVIQSWPERRYASAIIHSSYSGVKLREGIEYAIRRLQPGNCIIDERIGPDVPPIVEENLI